MRALPTRGIVGWTLPTLFFLVGVLLAFRSAAADSFQSRYSSRVGTDHLQGSGKGQKPTLPACLGHAYGLATAEAGHRDWAHTVGEFWKNLSRTGTRDPRQSASDYPSVGFRVFC